MNPDHKEKWNEGWDAYYNGKQREDCPYVEGASDYVSWTEGWNVAQIEAGRLPYEFSPFRNPWIVGAILILSSLLTLILTLLT